MLMAENLPDKGLKLLEVVKWPEAIDMPETEKLTEAEKLPDKVVKLLEVFKSPKVVKLPDMVVAARGRRFSRGREAARGRVAARRG